MGAGLRIVAVAAAMGVAGCVTQEPAWSDWQPVGTAERIIPYDPQAIGATGIRQSRIAHSGAVREVWTVPGGMLFAHVAGHGHAFRGTIDAAEFQELVNGSPPAERLGLEIDAGDVREDRNGIGPLYYAVVDSTKEPATCFVFSQPLALRALANYRDLPNGSGGFIVGVDCWPQDSGADAARTAEVLAFLGAS